MKTTELIHEIIELSEARDNRQIMNLLKELRKETVYEVIKELKKCTIAEVRLTDLPGKLYRRTYNNKIPPQ